jgi:hypothetical protein
MTRWAQHIQNSLLSAISDRKEGLSAQVDEYVCKHGEDNRAAFAAGYSAGFWEGARALLQTVAAECQSMVH